MRESVLRELAGGIKIVVSGVYTADWTREPSGENGPLTVESMEWSCFSLMDRPNCRCLLHLDLGPCMSTNRAIVCNVRSGY